MAKPNWTIGCSVDVKVRQNLSKPHESNNQVSFKVRDCLQLHEYKAGTPSERTFFVELWDVGGWSAHQNSRNIFYNGADGVILVHDLTNRKSQSNLRNWLTEVLNKDGSNGLTSVLRWQLIPVCIFLYCCFPYSSSDFDPEHLAGASTIPLLVIGTKQDLAEEVREKRSLTSGRSAFADECAAEEIAIVSDVSVTSKIYIYSQNPEAHYMYFQSCKQAKHLSPGSTNAVKLSRFFDKVSSTLEPHWSMRKELKEFR